MLRGVDRKTVSMEWFTPHVSVDDFVTAKALSFNKIQSTSTSGLQTIQQKSLRINKIP
jgi:hypothetical protein